MQDLISVIVPVYKVEKYLKRCVDSILAQTYPCLEVILVDDGSPDGCPAICDEYAREDRRVRVIHKENGGLSDARNAGIDAAKGKFLGFVDSDDYVHPRFYELLLQALAGNVRIPSLPIVAPYILWNFVPSVSPLYRYATQGRRVNTSYLTGKNHIIKECLKIPSLPCPAALRGVTYKIGAEAKGKYISPSSSVFCTAKYRGGGT